LEIALDQLMDIKTIDLADIKAIRHPQRSNKGAWPSLRSLQGEPFYPLPLQVSGIELDRVDEFRNDGVGDSEVVLDQENSFLDMLSLLVDNED
jgi:hypothetical protein